MRWDPSKAHKDMAKKKEKEKIESESEPESESEDDENDSEDEDNDNEEEDKDQEDAEPQYDEDGNLITKVFFKLIILSLLGNNCNLFLEKEKEEKE